MWFVVQEVNKWEDMKLSNGKLLARPIDNSIGFLSVYETYEEAEKARNSKHSSITEITVKEISRKGE